MKHLLRFNISSILVCWEFLLWVDTGILLKVRWSYTYAWWDDPLLLFYGLQTEITLIYFPMLNSLSSRINSHFTMSMSIIHMCIYRWMQLGSILSRNCAFCAYEGYCAIVLHSYVNLQSNAGFLKWAWKCTLRFSGILHRICVLSSLNIL